MRADLPDADAGNATGADTTTQVQGVGDRRVGNASISFNAMFNADANNGARKSFYGAVLHFNDSDPFMGVQLGTFELPSSALRGSHLEVGALRRIGRTGRKIGRYHFFASFLLRSDTAPLISVLNIRGMILLPTRGTAQAEMRLALSVPLPLGSLFGISSGD